MPTETFRRNRSTRGRLNGQNFIEAGHELTPSPTTDGGMGHADQPAEFGEGHLMLVEILTDVHGPMFTQNVQSAQEACATVTAAGTEEGAPPLRMHEHLRAWRTASGLTLKDVANRVGTTHATVSRWENGVQAIPPHKFRQLAEVYGATAAELLVAPADRDMALRFHRAAEIIGQLPPEDVEKWLGLGASLADAQKRNVR